MNGKQVAFAATIEYLELKKLETTWMNIIPLTLLLKRYLLLIVKEVTYEIGIYVDNQYMIQVFSNEGTFLKTLEHKSFYDLGSGFTPVLCSLAIHN
jgi:hypothetical protein